jgi:acrylyl-CoA reductase (NADPH)
MEGSDMSTFKALVVRKGESGQTVAVEDWTDADLMEGDVTVRVSHSTVNYKDGLALTGKAPVIRRWPMVPGIDAAGVVESSSHPEFKPGDAVILNGWGTGETHLGAYAQKTRVKGDWLVALPAGLSAAEAMAIGTAGYTAMLGVLALERHGLRPADGPVVVTGAAGGVGSVAIALLASAGWHVIASTGRSAEADYLKALGAAEIVERSELSGPARPLAKERWIAGVDSVGSHTLANLLAMTRYGGAVAACGLAQGMDLPASVAPFILRGVSLLGIDSVMCPKSRRIDAWARLARDLDKVKLRAISSTIRFDQLPEAAAAIMAGEVRGRVVVEIG